MAQRLLLPAAVHHRSPKGGTAIIGSVRQNRRTDAAFRIDTSAQVFSKPIIHINVQQGGIEWV
jgi:hypothetical protein